MKTNFLKICILGILIFPASCKKSGIVAGKELPDNNKDQKLMSMVTTMSVININSFPRDSGETDDQPRINRALATMVSGDILQFNTATYSLVSSTTAGTLKSGITIQGTGTGTIFKVNNSGWYIPFYLNNLNNVTLKDFKIVGYGTAAIAGADLIQVNNSSYCTLEDIVLNSFPWNGLSLGGTANNNSLTGIGAATGHAVGIILYGASVHHNTLDNSTAYYCGIGMSINAAHDNTVGTVITNFNRCTGFALDGILTNQGAYNNTIANLTATDNGYNGAGYSGGAAAYGGLYLGNSGTYGNVITLVNSSNNQNSGVCINTAHNNGIYTGTFSGNDLHGVRIKAGSSNWIGSVGLTCNSNTQHGISVEGGLNWYSNCSTGGQSSYNGWSGIYLNPASDSNVIKKLFANSNGGYGAYVLAGSTGNTFYQLSASGNTTGQTFWGSPVTQSSSCL
jgi:hypothetical protein